MNEIRTLHILYEDASAVIPEKPQDLPSEDTNGACLPSLLRETLAARGEAAEIYPVHRLDRPTGGAILYAKTKEAAAFYSSAVAHRELGKRYLAVLSGEPGEQIGTLTDYLYHDKRTNKVFTVKGERKGAKEARLEYRVIETALHEGAPLTLVEVNLLTGRTHQIRAQFASRKLPVFGDRRYGCRSGLPGGRIALWSHLLTFTPEGERSARTVTSVPPNEHPWDLFQTIGRMHGTQEIQTKEDT